MPPDELGNLDDVVKNILVTPPKAETKVADTPRVPEGDDAQNEPAPDSPPSDTPPVDEPPVDEDVDVDEIELDVLVDGKAVPVKVKELKDRYSLIGATEKRLQEATQLRQRLEAGSNELWQSFEQQKAKLQQLDGILAQNQPQNIDWETLRKNDPGRYLLERERFREIDDKRRMIAQEHHRVEAQQKQLADQARETYIANESQALLKEFPELAEEEKARSFTSNTLSTAKHFGFTEQEYAGVTDHRVLKVLAYAHKMLEQEAKGKDVALKNVVVRPLLKAGKTSGKPQDVGRRLQEANRKKAMETGRPEDVAKTLLVPRRRA